MGGSGGNKSSGDDDQQVRRGLNFESGPPGFGKGDYLDFELEIDPGMGREYPIAVLVSPAGEARERMIFPFDELSLDNNLKSLEIALLRSGGDQRQMLSPEERAVQDFGYQLFNNLFTGEVRLRYDLSNDIARRQGRGLRIKLRINAPELAALPWEFLYDPRKAEYVSLSRGTPIVRYIELPSPVTPLTVDTPIQILGMICSPSNLLTLRVDVEKQRLEKALHGLQEAGLVKLKWLKGQTWRDLQQGMRQGSWHIFHFIGHGGFNPRIDEGMLALCGEDGQDQLISATNMARLLADHASLRLVVLNTCEGARGSGSDIFSSTASVLVRRGLPAVLAMQYAITDRAAIEFSRSFYEAIADGLPVDAAVSEARKAICMAVTNTFEWGTPVLYMRTPQGILFDIPEEAKSKKAFTGGIAKEDLEKEKVGKIAQLFREGLEALSIADWDRAARSFKAVLDLQPSHAGASQKMSEIPHLKRLAERYASAKQSLQNQDFDRAMLEFASLVAEKPGYKDAQFLLQRAREKKCAILYDEAQGEAKQKNWQGVIGIFAKINGIDPHFPDEDNLLATAQNEIDRQARLSASYSLAVKAIQKKGMGHGDQIINRYCRCSSRF